MTASWSAAYAPHGSPVSSGPVDWPALRWSIAIIWNCPAYAVSGLIAAISHNGTLERIPPGASVNTGNPVPCWVYQIFAPPLSTYGTRVSSRDSDSLTPAYGRAACYDRTRRRARPRRTGAYAQTCCAAALLMPPGHERRWLRHARPMATLASTDEAERRIVRPLP